MEKENKVKENNQDIKQKKNQAEESEKLDSDQQEVGINDLSSIPEDGFKRLLGCG